MDTEVIAAVGTALVIAITVLAAVGTGIWRLSQLNNQFATQSDRISELREDMRHDFQRLREDFQELREDMRRGNQQLLIALANHEHDENGHAIFTAPVGTDAGGSDD